MVPAKNLWYDYLFLTVEMERFLVKKDYDLFFELMSQRERMQAQLDKCEDDFRFTPEGRKLLDDVRSRNVVIIQNVHAALSYMKQRRSLDEAYDGFIRAAGYHLDHKS